MTENSIDDVSTWGLDATLIWLEQTISSESLDILENLDQLHDLARAVMENKLTHREEVYSKLHAEMNNILAMNTLMKEEMLSIYDALITFYGKTLPDDIKKTIQKNYGEDIERRILEYRKNFANEKCSIVVAGETSAGKSSFLNLLLGENVLPSSHLTCTKKRCHIHSIPYGNPGYFEVTMDDGSTRLHNSYNGNKKKFLEDLKENLTSDNELLRKVDLYWHVPLLGDNTYVTIVDSPGIGHDQELSEELLNYLPNASALIFVINSSNCGGVQSDKLGKIFSRLKREIEDKNLFSFDSKSTMFILNKWDILKKRRRDEPNIEDTVWMNTFDNINEILTGFSWETCMYKMSIKDASTYMKCKMVTDEYRCMLAGLKQLVAFSLSVNARNHCRWLTQLHEDMREYLTIRVDDANSKYDKRDTKYKEVSTCLSKLRHDVDYIREDMELKCSKKCDEIAAKMHDHIRSHDVQAQIKRRINIDILPDEDLIKMSVLKQIDNLMVEEIKDFEKREQIIAKARDQLRMEINQNYHILIEKLVDVEKSIENKESKEESEFPIGEKVLIGVGLTIGIPVAVALSIALLPITLPVSIGFVVKRTKAIKRLLEQQDELKDECFNIALQKINKTVLKKYVDEIYFPLLQKMLDHISKEIPRKIEGLEQLVKYMEIQRLSAKEVKESYEPALENIQSMVLTLHELNLTHISECNIDVRRVRITGEIRTSDSLTVYAARLFSDDEEKKALVQLFRDAPTREYFETVKVLSRLRKTYNKNMVVFFGFCYTNRMPAMASEYDISRTEQFSSPRLMTVLEMCDTTLKDHILQNKDMQCGNPNKSYQKRALQFFCKTSKAICQGMLYLHGQGLLHRFIKLGNVMIKDGHVKINPPMIGSFSRNKRKWPKAPELANGQYTKKTDVFYIGVLLWELWYGRNASGHTGSTTEKFRTLPDCQLKKAMPEQLAQIVQKCWAADPMQRPSLGDVIAVIISFE